MKYRSLFRLALFLCLLEGCQENDLASVATIQWATDYYYRQKVDADFEFVFSIPHTSTSDVSIDYATSSGTAVAGVDFISTSGTATIPAGSLSTSIKVKIKGDSLRKDSQNFYLRLSNPNNCTMEMLPIVGVINNDGLYFPVDNSGYYTPNSYSGYKLVWSDEFNGKSVDENNWTFEQGNNGWGTHELTYYTNRIQNAFMSLGNLIIEARKEDGGKFTSARITTKGKESFKYGRIDIRAKMSIPDGTMSSLRMMGSTIDSVGWPACGEIDIMQLPHVENYVYNVLHWSDSVNAAAQLGVNNSLAGLGGDSKFHVFTAIWDVSHIEMYIDDHLTFMMNTNGKSFPFNNYFFFIFNLSVGGDWPGTPSPNAQFPQRMVVDYVRVFQKN
jgi:hypothetical protein